MCQEGQFIVDNISFYNDKKLATELTAEADWKRRGLYIGPQVSEVECSCRYRIYLCIDTLAVCQFDTLDVSVQDEFDKFLEERGINESLAFFVPEYAEFKEQKVRTRFDGLPPFLFKIELTHVLQEYVRWLNNVKSFIDA